MSPPRTEDFVAPTPLPGDDLFAPSLDTTTAPEPTSAKRLARGLGISLRRPGRAATPPPPEADDAFATLIVPMAPDQVERLRRGLEQDDCLYDRYQAARIRRETAQLGGAAIAAVLAVSLVVAWGNWVLAIRDIVPPLWLSEAVGLSVAEATTFVAAILLALAWLALIARASTDLLRSVSERSFAPFLLSIVEFTFALPAGLALFIPALPFAAIMVVLGLGVGALARRLIDNRMRL